MSALVVVFTAVMAAGSGPEKASQEVSPCLPTGGRWEGRWVDDHGFTHGVMLPGVVTGPWAVCTVYVVFANRPNPAPTYASYRMADEGRGKVRLTWNGWLRDTPMACLGIYRWDGDQLVICFREDKQGRPTSFRSGDGQHVLILRRVK
jgi:uncharacterized protein (TIGR03067 family)